MREDGRSRSVEIAGGGSIVCRGDMDPIDQFEGLRAASLPSGLVITGEWPEIRRVRSYCGGDSWNERIGYWYSTGMRPDSRRSRYESLELVLLMDLTCSDLDKNSLPTSSGVSSGVCNLGASGASRMALMLSI